MYLKQLDVIGFKSFADRTRLDFDPGLIAIVGPNGCGKSNVSDAIRWVLGEQRPTALRCSKLADVVFNGTDTRKPLGLAEVSITFADCEKELGTDYHEVTITRRVYRDGSGEYFINKQPSRLKDVQHLFMGTGIGTSSYSVMAQGQIDAILSSKPEDRRAVFEEAAGITKFKADRKEALRKIDQTQQNLLREEDVLKEMKRQIASLQRQVGKAQKYKELRDELRGLDIYVSKQKIHDFDLALEQNAANRNEIDQAIAEAQGVVEAAEAEQQALHAEIHELEERLQTLASEQAAADGAYNRANEVIGVNAQRIEEYRQFAERDSREIAEARRQLEEVKMQAESLAQKTRLLSDSLAAAKEALADAEATFRAGSERIDALRLSVQNARAESMQCDRRAAETRDEIARLEAAGREAIVREERLGADAAQLGETVAAAEASLAEVASRVAAAKELETSLAEAVRAAREEMEALRREVDEARANLGEMRSEAAATEAQLALLKDQAANAGEYPAGAQALLDGALGLDEGAVVGTLADRFDAESEYRIALEAALRRWLDAVIVKDGASAKAAVAAILAGEAGSARIVPIDSTGMAGEGRDGGSRDGSEAGRDRLLDHVRVADDFRAVAETLLDRVFVADEPYPTGITVSLKGVLYDASKGVYEVWMPGSAAASPLGRKMMISELETARSALDGRIAAAESSLATAAERAQAIRARLDESDARLAEARRAAAQAEGEEATVRRDSEGVRARLDRVATELAALRQSTADDTARRGELARQLDEAIARRDALMDSVGESQNELQRLESGLMVDSQQLTERRIAASQMEQELSFVGQQTGAAADRREELERALAAREEGVRGYEESIRRLTEESGDLLGQLDELKERAADCRARMEDEREKRQGLMARIAAADQSVAVKRADLDRARDFRGKLEVQAAETTMRRQNVYGHLQDEYGLFADAVMREDDPVWKHGAPPPMEELEGTVGRLQAEIAALGPVNMVAIDECRELEERYAKEKAQEEDLVAAKAQILDLINNLNDTSSDMFRKTFERANQNFQTMFTKLFGGGEARLVLLENEEDPLECGIDIIARPPGKRPQSVTLLSGGERTMTAVALLFSIFMIKPAPFCMLDELDAALDDANIGRFVEQLKEFLVQSQFLIITHNQHTIAGSDLVYGVSQQEKGVSRVISMKLSDLGVKAEK